MHSWRSPCFEVSSDSIGNEEDVISCPGPDDSPPHRVVKARDLWREQDDMMEELVRNSEPAGAFASSNASPLPTDCAAVGGALSSTSVLPPFDLKEFWEEEDAWVHSLTEDLAPRAPAVPAPFDLTEFWKEEDAWVQSLTVSARSASHTSPAAAASASSRSPDEIRVADQLELTEKKRESSNGENANVGITLSLHGSSKVVAERELYLLKALTKQCRAEDLSEHLRQQKHLRCVGVKSRCSDCRRFSDVMDHSLLPRVRMPLPHIDGSTAPTLEAMASNLGHGGQSKSSLQKIRSALLTFEAEAAKKRQHKRKLRGIVEADATSLRKLKLPRTTTLRYFQAFGVASRDSREVQLYDLGFADAQNYGKPPVESARAIEGVGGLNGVIREGTILCSDGARCYPKLCRTKKIKHFCCSHRQSQFNVKKRWQGKTIDVHTGTIDNVWRLIKGSLPKTLHTKSATNPTLLNGKIWTHVRAWQWRWENSSHKNLSKLTAQIVKTT
ncbi:unnamed protein product [Cladocopium goreaui]|uniref:Transposase n=1 Tax=Cladocopium goreaui TaxID=2562237 RepID=A0A9P1DJI1_9DINO|nr:unnamed protein product [Cladocopium goreaui]